MRIKFKYLSVCF